MTNEREKQREYYSIESSEIFPNADAALEAIRENKEREQEEKRKKLENKNPAFIQLTKGISPAVMFRIASESPTAIQILMYFLENMNNNNAVIVSQKELARIVNKTRQGVAKALKVLESNGSLLIGKVGTANVYIINSDLAWQGTYKQRRNVILNATVVMEMEDNEEIVKHFSKLREYGKENSITAKKANTSTQKIIRGLADFKKESTNKVSDEQMNAFEKELNAMAESYENDETFEYGDSNIPDMVPPWEE